MYLFDERKNRVNLIIKKMKEEMNVIATQINVIISMAIIIKIIMTEFRLYSIHTLFI